jgi:hypothetical protein
LGGNSIRRHTDEASASKYTRGSVICGIIEVAAQGDCILFADPWLG